MEHVIARKFKLGRKIGSGSLGELYLGVNVHNGEEVAVKLEKISDELDKRVKKFLRGAEANLETWHPFCGLFYVGRCHQIGKNISATKCNECYRLLSFAICPHRGIALSATICFTNLYG
ncbi:hypothetical protein DVH24_002182 [Malus domestica]|uniref:Protein kinase domain-containing protein n=1 Tax=Malus domestica TaxID=3750 RepID=A0A498I901_MALDO|nr:hypothetical protein DVH24_002182 [Malus domestica]